MDRARTRILVVDDVVDAADSVSELLALWGYDAVAVYDGYTALEAVRRRRPAAILLDLAMPGLDGFHFAACLRELPGCASVPIIATSGYSNLAPRTRARELGICEFLLKPAAPARLLEVIVRETEPPALPISVFAAPAADQEWGSPKLHIAPQKAYRVGATTRTGRKETVGPS